LGTSDFITENDYSAHLLCEGREDAGELVGHSASEWLTLPRVLRRDDVGRDDVFVDLGCGEGRMLLEAARRYRFKRVVGVELSGQLAAVASRNVAGHGRTEVVRSNVRLADLGGHERLGHEHLLPLQPVQGLGVRADGRPDHRVRRRAPQADPADLPATA
jgi:SAM-dependent methyltransferase